VDIVKVVKEIHSPALKEIVKSVWDTVDRIQTGQTTYKQASVEIAGHKHIIQAVVADWMWNKQKRQLGYEAKK